MPIRSSRLPKNQSAGRLDETAWRPSTRGRRRKSRPAKARRQPAPETETHSSSSSCSSRIAWSSLATQRQAFKQPIASPATSSASVQGACPDSVGPARVPAPRRAVSESPPTSRSAPSSPGRTRRPARLRRALSLRAAFAPTAGRAMARLHRLSWGSSVIVKSRHAADEVAFHLGLTTNARFSPARPASETRAPRRRATGRDPFRPCPAHGHEHIRPGLDETPSSTATKTSPSGVVS
jgi:hypothetical protein